MRQTFDVALLLVAATLTSCAGTNSEPGGARDPGVASPTTATSIPAPEAAEDPEDPEEFSMRVTADREVYVQSETVTFTIEVCNRGPATTTEGGGGSDIPFSFQIVDGQDEIVADDSHAIRTMELRMVRWLEGECRTAPGSWDQHYWNRVEDRPSEPPEIYGTPQQGDLVPPGGYRIQVASSHGRATSDPFELQQRS